MQIRRLDEFKGGWLVGNFDPSLFKNEHVEVAVKTYKPGERDAAHVHKVGTEITVVLAGHPRMGPYCFKPGDVLILKPGEEMPGDWTTIDPVTTVCIKHPSLPGDKYPIFTGKEPGSGGSVATKATGVPCYDKAAPDEPLFVLRAKDLLAPVAVEFWADLLASMGGDALKVQEARECAEKMRAWPERQHRAQALPD